MPVEVKVCGLTDARSLAAAVEGGARWLGFIFYPMLGFSDAQYEGGGRRSRDDDDKW